MIGDLRRCEPLIEEKKSISELQRGVYARENIQNGEVISRDKVYFAFPCHEGQLSTSEWQDRIIVKNSSIEKDQQIKKNEVEILINSDELILKTAIHKVKAMLSYAKIPINHEFTTEYSHHYGISNFQKFGAILINVINRIYAKKIIIQLPGQSHPLHYHKLKEETFIIIWGELISFLDGREKLLKPGDTLTVPPGVWHQFQTDIGCIFEEISTTAYPNDSVYKDNSINALPQSQRKTIVDHWGRFQINQQLSNEKKYF
jgi:N-acetylneuraminate synthase